jgi:hypothetical protein
MSAGSERGPGARAASTDAEYPYTFDDLCLALDWFAASMCDCVAQAWVLSDILRAFASSPSPSPLFWPGRGTPWEAPHKQAGPEPPGAGPGYDCGNGGRRTRTPTGETYRRAAPGGVGPEGGGRRGADRRPGPG